MKCSSAMGLQLHDMEALEKKGQNSSWKYEYKSEDALNLNNGRCVLLSIVQLNISAMVWSHLVTGKH